MNARWCFRRARYADLRLAARSAPVLVAAGLGRGAGVTAFALVCAGLLGCGAMVVVDSLAARPLPSMMVSVASGVFVGALLLGPPATLWVYFGVLWPRARRRVLAARCRVCPFCAHDLRGRPRGVEPCGECGRTILQRDAVIFWCRALARGGGDTP